MARGAAVAAGPALQAATALLADTGLELFGRIRSAPDPDRCSFEISVGDNALAFTPHVIVEIIHRLLQHGR